MTLFPPNSNGSSFRDRAEICPVSPEPGKEEKIVKIVQETRPAFRVLIADRDSMSSDLLAHALVRDRRFDADAVHSGNLLQALSTVGADLVVIGAEIKTKFGDGFDLAHTVGRMHPDISIVLLLTYATQESVVHAFRSGARGVFCRQQPMTEFLDCVEHVQKGYIWAGRQETDCLLDAFRSIPAPNPMTAADSPTLTTREMQVVQCAATGKTNRAIAGELGLSEHTVKNYLFRAFEKLGVSSRVELLFYLTLRGHTFRATKVETPDEDFDIA